MQERLWSANLTRRFHLAISPVRCAIEARNSRADSPFVALISPAFYPGAVASHVVDAVGEPLAIAEDVEA